MDLFKFIPGADPTDLKDGESINGITSASWTERYRDAGEFEILTPLSSGLLQFLPLGTFISHTNTLDVMVVENHNIQDDEDVDPVLSITGRSIEVLLEDRIVGANMAFTSNLVSPYLMAKERSWKQAVKIMKEHMNTALDPADNLAKFVPWTNMAEDGEGETQSIGRISVYQAVLELLAFDNTGIRVVRRNSFGHEGSEAITHFLVHAGVDKTDTVVFSRKAGDLEGAEYLWSNRTYANSALVVGRYVNVRYNVPGYSGYGRVSTVVKADDIDGHLTEPPVPTSPEMAEIITQMTVRGRVALANQNYINLIRADISEISKYQYRRDYDIGDIVTVDGNFGEIAPMRVVEYVEIMDENEEKGHPTLETPNPIA